MTHENGSKIVDIIRNAGFSLDDITHKEGEIFALVSRAFQKHGGQQPLRIAPLRSTVEYDEWDDAWHVLLGKRTVEEISAWQIQCAGSTHYTFTGRELITNGKGTTN